MSRQHPGRRARRDVGVEVVETRAASIADPNWRQHLIWLRDAVRKRFGHQLADDLTQETYLRIVDRAPGHRVENPRGLLMTVASNLARDGFRRERVRAEHAAQPVDLYDVRGVFGHTAEDDLAVREVILSLPPNLRDVLLLSKIGGLTNREIAQRYGLTVRAIDKRLQKAIALFVTRLRD